MHQKWNNEAKNIQSEASNIFSFEAFKDCIEINRLMANKTKKLAITKFVLLRIEGKKSTNKK